MDLLEEYYSSDEEEINSQSDAADVERPTINGASVTRKAPPITQGTVKLVDSMEAVTNGMFVREVPHVRGNWAGHVFVSIPTNNEAMRSAQNFCRLLEATGWSGTVVSHASNLHLSLSRPFFLQESFIEPFVKALQERLEHEQDTRLFVTGETLLVNDACTRSFWCWSLSSNAILLRILGHVNAVLEHYQQERYYESPKFHVSVASLAGDARQLLKQQQQHDNHDNHAVTFNSTVAKDENGEDEGGPIVIAVDHVTVTFGTTKSFRIDLG